MMLSVAFPPQTVRGRENWIYLNTTSAVTAKNKLLATCQLFTEEHYKGAQELNPV